MQVNKTLSLEKRQGAFIRAGVFIGINMVNKFGERLDSKLCRASLCVSE